MAGGDAALRGQGGRSCSEELGAVTVLGGDGRGLRPWAAAARGPVRGEEAGLKENHGPILQEHAQGRGVSGLGADPDGEGGGFGRSWAGVLKVTLRGACGRRVLALALRSFQPRALRAVLEGAGRWWMGSGRPETSPNITGCRNACAKRRLSGTEGDEAHQSESGEMY